MCNANKTISVWLQLLAERGYVSAGRAEAQKRQKKTDFKYLLTSVIVAVKIKQYYKEAENIPFFSKQSTLPEKYHGRKNMTTATLQRPNTPEVKR